VAVFGVEENKWADASVALKYRSKGQKYLEELTGLENLTFRTATSYLYGVKKANITPVSTGEIWRR